MIREWLARWRGPWVMVRREENGWLTIVDLFNNKTDGAFVCEIAGKIVESHGLPNRYQFLPKYEADLHNKRMATEQWLKQPSLTQMIDSTDHEKMVAIAQWSGGTLVTPDDGFPEDVVMILKGMQLRHRDIVVKSGGTITVIPAEQ